MSPCAPPARLARAAALLALAIAMTAGARALADPGLPPPKPPGAAAADELDCVIEPRSRITLSSPLQAVVERVSVDRGDLVEKGQVVAALESSVERATVASAAARARTDGRVRSRQAKLDFAMRGLGRSTELSKKDAISAQQLDEAEHEKRVAEADVLEAKEDKELAALELERAKAALELRSIHSPVKGVVVRRILSPGEFADPPQILEIAEIDPLRVEVFAPVSWLGRVKVGQRAFVVPEAPAGGSYEANVTVVDRVVDAASGTFGVRLELPNPAYALPAGLKCRVRFVGP
jgi:RND family efflux transporter MFP subunit